MDEKKLQEMMDEITNGKDYDKEQMLQIQYGIEDGLTKEQIQFYADSKFSDLQMEEIRWGFEDGLTMKQVQTYAKPEFDSEQMRQIRGGLESKLTMKQVSIYTNSEFNEDQMYEIRCGLEHGLTMEQVQTYAKPEFDSEQMLEMREEAESHLSEITIHYKGELGEFDYNRSDYVLLQDREGKDYLHYNEYISNATQNLIWKQRERNYKFIYSKIKIQGIKFLEIVTIIIVAIFFIQNNSEKGKIDHVLPERR